RSIRSPSGPSRRSSRCPAPSSPTDPAAGRAAGAHPFDLGVADMTSSDPEVIRRQIEDTRRELSYDVDALNEKVNPTRVMDRRVSNVKGRFSNMKEKVMGTASDTTSHAQGMASNAA